MNTLLRHSIRPMPSPFWSRASSSTISSCSNLFSQDGNPLLLFQERLYRALAPRLCGTLVINLLPRTALELTHALTLIEQWIGPATPYPVAGLINVIVHVTPRDETSSDL